MVVGKIQFFVCYLTESLISSLAVDRRPPSVPCHAGPFGMAACFFKVCKKAIKSANKRKSWSYTLIMEMTTHKLAAFYPSEKVIRSRQTPTLGEGITQRHDY